MSQSHDSEFTEIWRSVCKLSSNNTTDKKTGQQIHGTPTTAMCKDLQSPKRIGFIRYPGLNNGDSPGDGEPSQDIFWDSTSPTAGPGHVNTRVVEISDIANRIAPKDVKRNENDSPLVQWIGDGAFHCTPETPTPSVRKKSSRKNSVDDLKKLAWQFDENMKQDRKLTETSVLGNVKDPTDQVEAELHALFDSSTQQISGFLSQGSSTSASAQKTAAHPAGARGSCNDDWEDDDLLDSFVLSIPDKITKYQKGGVDSVKDISDSLWDDGDDDALLYQVCDTVEKISNSQPQQASTSNCQAKQDIYVDRQRKTPVPIDTSRLMVAGANSQSPRAFFRSNSLPETNSKTVNYHGWNIPIKGASNRSQTSQSHPGSRGSLGTFNQDRDSSGTFQARNVDMKPHSVSAGTSQSSKSHHTAFKRNVSHSAAISSKVFVTSQMTAKCSAAEIERKKQEALARRRQRMQNAPKP
ncbi:uncharacterized protein LOC117542327 isoform X2 [Gymnodraco acuticeps]|uniref:Uncharacterized protein LOC117542327 isoform X2 n=1 Tax=Gymnodraco acuticeps TaxID=8218 RepID=A0A6P8UI05_GYMAC|nr:uncharacterized protein LOC117542327 isoform X2 [Gymnodraco acuticeps]